LNENNPTQINDNLETFHNYGMDSFISLMKKEVFLAAELKTIHLSILIQEQM